MFCFDPLLSIGRYIIDYISVKFIFLFSICCVEHEISFITSEPGIIA